MAAPKNERSQPTPIKLYLVAYNALSTLGWAYLLLQTVLHVTTNTGTPLYVRLLSTYAHVGSTVALVQSCALLEVVHVLLGWVRSPLLTTVMQVSSRLFLVWGVTERFGSSQTHPLYPSMILAWSITEVIRYAFYAFSLLGSSPPFFLTYLRYTTFYALYPIGASSEAFLILASVPSWTGGTSDWTVWDVARAVLFTIWWPGLYVMFTYMMAQRRKVLGGGGGPARKGKKSQ
ncbi:hypothetical protein AMATHDRAFT_82719 [Amanita thiersii Skay4041]|uniref:Very-long-chain (3R)-3-hydroxyacyl-CoA dehydratase n=1 Tax=Amanita thiersii Skay4041 TaxID=703135 RepID=A0A2A9N9T8_9AGAR|nr:hypothetical protein AMATHDRAFT_82719 [Amanita thiersii Skay4041]